MGLFDRFKNKPNEDLGKENKKEESKIVTHGENKYRITRNKDGSFNFGRNRVEKLDMGDSLTPEFLKVLLSKDYSNSKLKWLFDAEFQANEIEWVFLSDEDCGDILEYRENSYFDRKGEITLQSISGCNWINGDFNTSFYDPVFYLSPPIFNGGIFNNGLFEGYFCSPNSNYKSHPTTFLGGGVSNDYYDPEEKCRKEIEFRTWGEYVKSSSDEIIWQWEGCLGLKSIVFLERKDNFHMIQLPNRYQIEIIAGKNKHYVLTVTESLFHVTGLPTKEKQYIEIENVITHNNVKYAWATIRQDFNNYMFNINSPLHINGAVHIPNIREIKCIGISPYTSTGQNGISNNLHLFGEIINFSEFPSLNINQIIEFDCFDESDIKSLFEIHDSLYNNTFFTELKCVKTLLNSGYVNGYGKFNQLKTIFNNKPGDEFNYEKSEVKQVFDFLLKINLLINNAQGKENRELLLESFKTLLFSEESGTDDSISKISSEIDFSKDDRLGMEIKMNFNFNSQLELEEFNKYKIDAEEGKFYSLLMQTQRLMQNGELLGYHNKLELKSLFREEGSTEPPASEKAQNCLNYLSLIKKYLIDTVQPKEDAEKLITVIKLIITDNN